MPLLSFFPARVQEDNRTSAEDQGQDKLSKLLVRKSSDIKRQKIEQCKRAWLTSQSYSFWGKWDMVRKEHFYFVISRSVFLKTGGANDYTNIISRAIGNSY